MNYTWFLIINPKAGNANFDKQFDVIKNQLNNSNIKYVLKKTKYAYHEKTLVKEAINKGYSKFIVAGGDGTLHHVVNGIMEQQQIETNKIKIGIIPLGTGNDWIKTYSIPKNTTNSIKIIKKENAIYQDIGLLKLNDKTVYFTNIASIGYDGYVVKKLKKIKYLGSIAYLLTGLYGLIFYKKSTFKIEINNTIIEAKCLMTVFGICKFYGGGMQVTDYKSSSDGLLDVTIAKNLTFFEVIFNIKKLYNGLLINHNKVTTSTTKELKITPTSKNKQYIQADGELIGTGSLSITIIKQAIQFVIP